MAHPFHHALSSARKYGGVWQDYIAIHDWFDETKKIIPDVRHRALRHHAEGIFLCEQIFGKTFIRQSDGKEIPTRWIGEQHVFEDFGFIPTVEQFFKHMEIAPWMARGAARLAEELERDAAARTAITGPQPVPAE